MAGGRNHKLMIWPSTFFMDIMKESLPQGKTRDLFMGWRFLSVMCVWMCLCLE